MGNSNTVYGSIMVVWDLAFNFKHSEADGAAVAG